MTLGLFLALMCLLIVSGAILGAIVQNMHITINYEIRVTQVNSEDIDPDELPTKRTPWEL
jgi:hypothetical protein